MVNKNYIPAPGDLVWMTFNKVKGHEQEGRRPALVVSPHSYNKKTGLALMCPITSQQKGYSFEVSLDNKKIKGVVLADHIRNLDWKARNAEFIKKTSKKALEETKGKIELLIQG